MNCETAQELLSACYDRELNPDVDVAVHGHAKSCANCAQRLAEFTELSDLAADLRQPAVPAGMWSAISSSLDAQTDRRPGRSGASWLRLSPRAAIAAALLVGLSVTFLAFWRRNASDEGSEMAATFGRYLSELDQSPQRAQQVLLTQYGGRLVDLNRAVSEVKFEPNAPEELPNGFKRRGIYVLKMPCCTCTQTLYTNSTGDTIAIFEHVDEQQDWFGSRPTMMAQCRGKQTCLVQVRDRLAATWKCGRRYLTVVGARNVKQVAELVAFLDRQSQALASDKGAT